MRHWKLALLVGIAVGLSVMAAGLILESVTREPIAVGHGPFTPPEER